MNLYFITYDLKTPGRNYSGLFEVIKREGAWWHYLESVWMVVSQKGVDELNDLLRAQIDQTDRLLVFNIKRLKDIPFRGWLAKDAWDWIQSRLSEIQ